MADFQEVCPLFCCKQPAPGFLQHHPEPCCNTDLNTFTSQRTNGADSNKLWTFQTFCCFLTEHVGLTLHALPKHFVIIIVVVVVVIIVVDNMIADQCVVVGLQINVWWWVFFLSSSTVQVLAGRDVGKSHHPPLKSPTPPLFIHLPPPSIFNLVMPLT